jgi:hypothetical protein
MIIEVKDRETFVPQWNGNRDKDPDDQIRVHYRYLNAGERERYVYLDKDTRFSTDGKPEMVLHQDQSGLTRAMVTLIENLAVKGKNGVTEIKTADQLYSTAGVPNRLLSEIEGFMLGAEPEVDKDFLPEDSAST